MRSIRIVPRALMVALVATVLACGGSGGGGGGGGGSTPSFDGSFTPDTSTPGTLTVSMVEAPAGGGDLVVVQVGVTNTGDVYGADFTVRYDPTAVQYVSRSPGSLLESGGQSVVYQAEVVQPGQLVVGASRINPVPGATATGTRVLVHLTFRLTRVGTSPLSFENSALLDSTSSGPQPISGLSWHGGTMVAN